MARPATGQIIEPKEGGRKTWAIRLSVPGHGRPIVTLGSTEEGWTRLKAEEALKDELAAVRLGTWRPPKSAQQPAVELHEDPTYKEWAEHWLEEKLPGLEPKTITDYKWALEKHLLPFFAEMRLSEITIEEVDRYRNWKLRQGNLSPNSVNKTITRLGQTLQEPVEYPRFKISVNPAVGKKRKAKPNKVKRTWLDVEQIPTFVEVAGSFERPLIAVLVGCGLRIWEAVALDWADVNLATGTVFVRESKTETGEEREVDIPAGALEELKEWKARSPKTRPTDPVFISGRRRKVYARQTVRNAEARFAAIIKAANAKLGEAGIHAIDHITPHGLRRTFASVRAACGDDPVYIAEQGGWADPRFVFSVYQKAAKRRSKLSGRYRVAFDAALVWARLGTDGGSSVGDGVDGLLSEIEQTASESQKHNIRGCSSAG